MGLKNQFSKLDLARQIQLTFVVFIIVLSGFMVTITKLQLDWLETEVRGQSREVIETSVFDKMKVLAKSESRFVENEFKSYIKVVHTLRDLSKTVLEENKKVKQFLADRTPVFASTVEEETKDWTTFVYGSKYGQAISGDEKELVDELARLNPVISSMRAAVYVNIYQGFELKEVYNRYPGVNYETTTYTPIVHEWYFRASENPNSTILTEPYIDSLSGTWVFSASVSIQNSSNHVIGVAGADIALKSITVKVSEISFMGGYEILVTQAGMILTKPSTWDVDETVRIYDTSQTGFTYNLWEDVLASSPGDRFDFTDINGTNFYMTVGHVAPYSSASITHYILIFVSKAKVDKPGEDLHSEFRDLNSILFWVVLSITSAVILISFTLIYFQVKSTIIQLRSIEKLFRNIIRRALFTKSTRDVNTRKLDYRKSGIEELVEGCKYKVRKISELEEQFSYYKWGLTRPRELNIYSTWSQRTYPFNKFYGKKLTWRENLKELEKPTIK